MVFSGDHTTSAFGGNVDLKLLHVTCVSINVSSVKVIARFSVPMLEGIRHLLIYNSMDIVLSCAILNIFFFKFQCYFIFEISSLGISDDVFK